MQEILSKIFSNQYTQNPDYTCTELSHSLQDLYWHPHRKKPVNIAENPGGSCKKAKRSIGNSSIRRMHQKALR